MNSAENFDWDKWISNTSYIDVINKSPIGHFGRAVPTSICPVDNDVLYINSIDEWIDLNDQDHVKQSLENIVRSYLSRSRNNSEFGLDALILTQRQYDFEVLCVLTQERFDHVDNLFNGEYEQSLFDAKELFNEMANKLKP